MPETLAPDWETAWEAGTRAAAEGRFDEAVENLRTAARAADEFEDTDARKSDTFYVLGSTLARLERVEEADPILTRALTLRTEALGMGHPQVAATLYVMGEMYRQANRYTEAQHALVVASEIVEKLELENELAGDISMSASLVLKKNGLVEESFRHATRAAQFMAPDNRWRASLLELGASLVVSLGAYDAAADLFARIAADQQPGQEQNETLAALADMQLLQGLWEEALKTVGTALQVEPRDVALLRRRAVCQSRLGEPDEAEASLLLAREIAFSGQAEFTKMMAEVNVRAERWEKAAERFEETLLQVERDPRMRAEVRLALGKVYLQLNRPEDAGRQFSRAASARRRMKRPPIVLVAEALQLLGTVQNGLGRPKRAYRRLSDALTLMESDLVPRLAMSEEENAAAYQLTLAILLELSICLERLERFSSAAGVLKSVMDARQASTDAELLQLADQADRLSALYDKAGKPRKSRRLAQLAEYVRNSHSAE